MNTLTAFNLREWIDDHRDRLRPPVCNQQIFEEDDFIVMVVGGPNTRKDYHVDEGPELFFQIEGDMMLNVLDDDEFKSIPVREGEMLLLPPRVPHSPQRFPDTVGLVVERKRLDNELDGFMWFCDNCGEKLHEEFLHVDDIVGQLPPVFERFYDNESNRTCDACGSIMPKPKKS
jgi:3-hydroxyanthranilate 3,4-dioxygenase